MVVHGIVCILLALGVASVKSDCILRSCGVPGFPVEGLNRVLQLGPTTTERIYPYMCEQNGPYNTIVGFTASICTIGTKPEAFCGLEKNTIVVHKNGKHIPGKIQFTAYCGASKDAASENHLSSRYENPAYYDDPGHQYRSSQTEH